MRLLFLSLIISAFLNANGAQIKTISSNFTQNIISAEGDLLTYEGSFYASNTNLALWIYEIPTHKKIYFLRDRVIIIEPDLEQAIQASIEDVPDIATMLQMAIDSKKELYETNILDINYFVDFKNGVPVSIKYTDKLENKNEIKLKNVKINEELDEKIFNFIIPKNYDIIYN